MINNMPLISGAQKSPHKFRVVGLAGQSGLGKDTYIANHLIYNFDYTRIALADAIKSGFDDLSGTDHHLHKHVASMRREWQLLGTEARDANRDHDMVGIRFVWAYVTICKITYMAQRFGRRKFVVPDIRYCHEENALRDAFGSRLRVYRVLREHAPKLPELEASHTSETSIDDVSYDETIENVEGSKSFVAMEIDESISKWIASLEVNREIDF